MPSDIPVDYLLSNQWHGLYISLKACYKSLEQLHNFRVIVSDVLGAANPSTLVFWVVTLSKPVSIYQRFEGKYSPIFRAKV